MKTEIKKIVENLQESSSFCGNGGWTWELSTGYFSDKKWVETSRKYMQTDFHGDGLWGCLLKDYPSELKEMRKNCDFSLPGSTESSKADVQAQIETYFKDVANEKVAFLCKKA